MASSSDCTKLEKCEVCAANNAKYTCPKCEVRTCSLNCAKIHKKELECDGIRHKTKYVPLKSLTDLDLLNDYRLLEEVGRSIDQLHRDPLRKDLKQRLNFPVHLQKLKTAALQKKVRLLFMPQSFTKHKTNTTFLKWKTNELFWRIEWIFPAAGNMKLVTEKALDTIRLSQLIEQIYKPHHSSENENDSDELKTALVIYNELQYYRSAGLSGIKVLLKAENVENADSKFHELDITLTLKENLENKTIIEFPTIYVVLKDHAYTYNIIDCDSEEEINSNITDRKNRNHYSREENQKSKVNKQKQPNYFFSDGISDSDEEQ